MNKILVVAQREYLAAVRTKAFLVSLIVMPLMMMLAIVVQQRTDAIRDTQTYKVAVIDRTPGGKLADAIVRAAERRNTVDRFDKKTRRPAGPAFAIEVVAPAPLDDAAAVDRQRLELSRRTRDKELLGFAEIGPNVVEPNVAGLLRTTLNAKAAAPDQPVDASPAALAGNLFAQLNELPDDAVVRYSTNQPTLTVFRNWLQQAIAQPVAAARMAKLGVNPIELVKLTSAILPPPIVDRGMADAAGDGAVRYDANNASLIVNWIVPVVLVAMMFVVVMVGASPLATNIVEEKQLRIAEVLLGGLRPFELMLGKLLGGAGVSVTLAAIYSVGVVVVARRLDMLQYVRPEALAWFVLFTVLGVMMYGSLFVAAGAAVTNVKEAQTTLAPVMILVALPIMALRPILEYPDGALARAAAFFPLTAPSISIIRAAIPGAAAPWEMALSALSATLGTLAVIWVAGRIFRAGMLLTSKPASIAEAIRWIVRG